MEGLTKTYNRFHDPDDFSTDMQELRDLHVEMDNAVAVGLRLVRPRSRPRLPRDQQGTRFTISESARREVLARLLKLHHERYAEEVAQDLHDKKARVTKQKAKAEEAQGQGLE